MLIKTLILFFFASKAYALSYEHIWHGYASVHIVIVDPKEHIIAPVKASPEMGRETVETLAKRYKLEPRSMEDFGRAMEIPQGS